MVNKRQYKNNRSYRTGYDDGYDDGFGKGLKKSRNKIDKLTNDIIEADRLNEELTAKNKEMRETNRKQQEVNRKQQEVNRKQQEVNRKQREELKEQEIKLEEHEIELNVQKGRINGLKERQKEIDADVRKLEEEYQDNLDKIIKLGAESDGLESDIFDIDKDLIQLRDNPLFSDELRADFSRLRRERQAAKKAKRAIIKSNQRTVNKLIKQNEGVNSKINNLKVKCYDLTRNEIRMA